MTIEECNRDISMGQFLRLAEENDVKNAERIVKEISEVVQSFTDKATEVKIDTCFIKLISELIKTKIDLNRV